MGEVRYMFRSGSPEEVARAFVKSQRRVVADLADADWLAQQDAAEQVEIDRFVRRVRLPGSGAVMRLFDRWEAWKARRVEAKAQAAFEAPLRWGWCS